MRILPYSVIPIFLGGQAYNGTCGSQLRYFDVYYTSAPVVGFDVICCPEELPPCWLESRPQPQTQHQLTTRRCKG